MDDIPLIGSAALAAFIEYRYHHGEWPPVEDEGTKRLCYRLFEQDRKVRADQLR